MKLSKHASDVVLSENAIRVLEKRYLKINSKSGVPETPKDMFMRVAYNIASADSIYDVGADIDAVASSFYEEMVSLRFLPNSPTLMNAGGDLQQLAACFVLPIEDSLSGIFESVKNTALIHKSGGGTGFSFSRLRPSDDTVMSTKGVSSGPVSFMSVFDSATETIKQGGTRRGANMGILNVDHPDIMSFINAKKDKDNLSNFNLSVAVTDKFMKAVKKGEDYALINPRDGSKQGSLNAGEVFDTMVSLAHQGGDPGIIFIDKINKDNPTPKEGKIESTNPCGEQPLLPYESCNLGSINLAKFVVGKEIDWDALRSTIHKAVHFLDNVIDMNSYPIEEIDKMTKRNRKIGLGVMGWADMLVMLEVPYNSDKSLELAEEVMKFIRDNSRKASVELAEKRGSFPGFDDSIYPAMGFTHLRNATTTTIAPTGTISILAGASSGIEPYFAIAFYRYVMDGDKLPEVNSLFVDVAKREGFYSEDLANTVAKEGFLHNNPSVPAKWQDIFVTAHEISPEWHIKVQAAFQKYTDNAVSKTVNFGFDATVEDVKKVYALAYSLNCKGTTIYRDGCRDEQVLNVGSTEATVSSEVVSHVAENEALFAPRPRPKMLVGKTLEMITGCGKLYVTLNQDEEGKPFEVFTSIGKAGGCATSQCEAIGRLISVSLRSGCDPQILVGQLKGISCHMKSGFGPNQILSCADAVGKALEQGAKYPVGVIAAPSGNAIEKVMTVDAILDEWEDDDIVELSNPLSVKNGACPECGAPISFVEGCDVCYSCGYSHCS